LVFAVIAAGGRGSRFKKPGGKQFFLLKGKPVLVYTLEKFLSCNRVDFVLPVIGQENFSIFNEARKAIDAPLARLLPPVQAGEERFESVLNGLKRLQHDFKNEFEDSIILIHDGARPFVSTNLIERVIDGTKEYGACVPAVKVADTVKRVDSCGKVLETLKRSELVLVQTPQGFLGRIIMKAYEEIAKPLAKELTDDASFVELTGYEVRVIDGERLNIKITYPEDEFIATALLKREANHK